MASMKMKEQVAQAHPESGQSQLALGKGLEHQDAGIRWPGSAGALGPVTRAGRFGVGSNRQTKILESDGICSQQAQV